VVEPRYLDALNVLSGEQLCHCGKTFGELFNQARRNEYVRSGLDHPVVYWICPTPECGRWSLEMRGLDRNRKEIQRHLGGKA
jgi:hypothetical protein